MDPESPFAETPGTLPTEATPLPQEPATHPGRPKPHKIIRASHKLPFGPFASWFPPIAAATLRTIGRSCRLVESRNEEYTLTRVLGERKPVIFAVWHSRMLYTIYHMQKRYRSQGVRMAVLVSSSRDGELIAQVIQYMRGDVVRGSTSRGGREALYGLLDSLKAGLSTWVTPDGPRGPRQKAQFGAIALAQKSGLPLIPVSCSLRRCITLNSWDRFVFPIPFSPVRMHFGAPLFVPGDADETMREYFRQKLEDDLNGLTAKVDDWHTLYRD